MAGGIDRIEPPSWWHGFEHRQLQLMVHGDGIARFEPTIDHEGIAISSVQRSGNDNYLFVYLDIESASPPGEIDLEFRDGNEILRHRFAIRARDARPGFVRGFSSADAIYLVTPDRFANGNPDNDSIAGLGDSADRADPFGRHGGDIEGIRQHLDYIAALGFTQLWLNPVLENAMPERSYHGYATTNYYSVDPRLGSNEDYRRLVDEARDRRLGVIMDMVPNHCGSGHWWMSDLPTGDWLNFPGADRQTNHARTTVLDPYASAYDRTLFTQGWFSRAMPDLNQANPLLRDYLVQNAIWWIEYLGLSGIRVDTYSYSDKIFLAEWTRRIMQEYPDFNMVGEEWITTPAITSYWQAGKNNHDGYVSQLPGLMDFPLQSALVGALTAPEPSYGSVWTPVYELLGNDFLYADPGKLVIFPDNHDMSRIYTQLGENPDLWRMAMVFYLTMRGIPQIFYGTEILMTNPGTDSHGVIRSDFPGGWQGDPANAFTGQGLDRDATAAQSLLQKLLRWRSSMEAVQRGKLMQFTPIGNVYVYFRYDDATTIMVAFNRGSEAVELGLSRFAERIGKQATAVDVISGVRYRLYTDETLHLGPMSVRLLEIDN